MKKRTMEERAKETWGTTLVPQFCTYMLTTGEMLNGSYEGYWRDRDHREINVFMPHLKTTPKGTGYPYIIRFMKRGNIRMSCNKESICFEFWKIPTREQWGEINSILREAEDLGMNIYIEKYYPKKSNKVFQDRYDFMEYLLKKIDYFLY